MPPDQDDPNAAVPGTPTPGTGDPAPTPASSQEGEPGLSPSIKARMDELTAEKWAKHREAAAAEARARVAEAALAEANQRLAGVPVAPGVAQPPVAPRATGRETANEIEARAQELARTQMFNEKCSDVYRSGVQAYPDFQVKLNDLNRMVGGNLPREFVEAALATGKAHEAIYRVASDPAVADRVMTMSPYQQVVEMDRLVRGGTGPSPSPLPGAPRPISSQPGMRGPSPTPNLEDENLPMQDWIKLREKDLKDRGVHPRLA